MAARQGENFSLYGGHINPAFVKMISMAGFGRRFVSASGCTMTDDTGREYLDFVSGYGALNLGHNHPRVVRALRDVLDSGVPSFSQVDCGILAGLAAEALTGLMPPGLDKAYFCGSGSEAVDAAMKLARAVTGRKRFICCEGAFHGNTLGVLGLTDNPHRRDRFRPLLSDIKRVPFDDATALDRALAKKDCAAFIVEPVLGEGGVVVPGPDYLVRARDICDRTGTLLVLDEVQTGLGRTGSMFAFQQRGISPDAIALAKSLGGGLVPAGAMACRGKLFKKAYGSLRTCLDHRNTFGGGPLAMAALLATIDVIRSESLTERARDLGARLLRRLAEISGAREQIEEVRGVGLMLAVKFRKMRAPGTGWAAGLFAQHVSLALLKRHGIITQVAANDFSVLKIMPPLVIDEPAIDRFADALDEVLGRGGHGKAMLSLAGQLFSKHTR